MDEAKVLKRLRRGDVKALALVLEEYTPYVRAIIGNIGRESLSESDAEEIAQDVFLTLYANRTKIEIGKCKAYLASIARSKTKDRLRGMDALPVDIADVVLLSESDPADETERASAGEMVKAALSVLDERTQKVLILYYYWYFTTPEIAERLGIPVATVKTILFRGREKLKKQLGGALYEEKSI